MFISFLEWKAQQSNSFFILFSMQRIIRPRQKWNKSLFRFGQGTWCDRLWPNAFDR